MENSYRFFENKDCKFYPCHRGLDCLNCLFCYCPLYHMEPCPGKNEYKDIHGKRVKVCTDCTFPHEPGNYDKIMECLKSRSCIKKE